MGVDLEPLNTAFKLVLDREINTARLDVDYVEFVLLQNRLFLSEPLVRSLALGLNDDEANEVADVLVDDYFQRITSKSKLEMSYSILSRQESLARSIESNPDYLEVFAKNIRIVARPSSLGVFLDSLSMRFLRSLNPETTPLFCLLLDEISRAEMPAKWLRLEASIG